MRTTVSISDELLAAAKQQARASGRTLGDVVDAALRRELAAAPPGEERAPVPVFRDGTGPRPGLDLGSNRALYEALDEGRELVDRR